LAKKKVEKPKREFTKRQLSQWQRQKKRQRLVFSVGVFIIAVVLVVIGAGWYINRYQPLHETVVRVNDTEFNMNYYIKILEYYGEGYPIEFMYSLTDRVVEIIQQNELVKQEAMKLGIMVSNSEVNDELKERDPPLSKDYRDLVRAEMLVSKLRDEYFDQQVPASAEQRHVLAMLLESESQATEVKTRLDNGDSFAELAAELSLDYLSLISEGDLGWHPETILTGMLGTSIPEEYAFSAEVGVLSQPVYDEARIKSVGYWLIEVLETEEDSDEVHVQAMLLASEQEAQSVTARLEAGEDFAALADELSQLSYPEGGEGDLGWLTPDMMTPAFEEFVFDSELKLETLSHPIRDESVSTKGGYWLLKVLAEQDNRKISDDDRDLLKAKALDEWLSSLWDDPQNEVESYLDDAKKIFAITYIMES